MSYTIRDSSIYEDRNSVSLLYGKDCAIRIGTVREEVWLDNFGQTRYNVEVLDNGRLIPVGCITTSRFGGIYNYEEQRHRTFKVEEGSNASTIRELQPGDQVVVAFLNGDSREGVILSCINHFGRKEALNRGTSEFINREGPTYVSYASEFNGVETLINSSGEYRVTFKGQPDNIKELDLAPNGDSIPLPEYDTAIGSSYYEFDKTGSFMLNDNAVEKKQYIYIDKKNGTINIVSGENSLVIDKNKNTYSIKTEKVNINAKESFSLSTKLTTVTSKDVNVEATNITTTGEWSQSGNMSIDGNVDTSGNGDVAGNFSAEGNVSLGGGANPLVYDIVLTIGTGNLGAPVISNNVMLKTVKTKAT